ncbi:MAG TPA: bacteriohopanetetrol glucosamine biosynthesis glycosyltransferase HpnI [Candidatus Binataceae bacterium]|nr:bacteriohopanetetrol glucosamine biosynthesis glycosyltransferase HpnI [Candidatus Binataceae bacterium]
MIILRSVALACVAISILYYAAAAVAAERFARHAAAPVSPLPKIAPRVAVLKPLHGLNRALPENIVSFLEAGYPRIDYFFAVSSYEDPAAQIPAALRARYQFANLTLIVGDEPECVNLKIAKVIRMADRAEKAEIFVLSDADIRVDRDYLRRVVGELAADEKIGVVTCAYRAQPNNSITSRMEALFINTDFAPQVMLSDLIEPMRHALGATIAIKRAALESIGGFRAVRDNLADDFYIGRMAADHGWKVKLSSALVTIIAEEDSLAHFWNHQLRWARTYRKVRPVSMATIVTHGPFWALVLLLASRAGTASLIALAAVVAARLAMSAFMLRRVLKLPDLIADLWLVLPKDLVLTAVWFASLASNKVIWAGRKLEVMRGGEMRAIKG